jgi:branched-chain amino acid transport system substrate-binding protein
MIRPTPLWRTLAVLGAASLIVTACGGDDDNAGAGASPSSTFAAGDGTLKLGTLLPQTGDLAFLNPPMIAGVKKAVQDINDGGGVLGKPITEIDTDSGDDSPDLANPSVDQLLQQKVDAIVGAAASGVSLNVIDKITGNGVIQLSPSNTSPAFTTYADHNLYFRTAPSDALQGRVLGDLMLQDGRERVAILNRQDAYGTGLADALEKAVTGGGGQVVIKKTYAPDAADFASLVSEVKAANPDSIALITFDEANKLIPELIKQGLPNSKAPYYFVDGNLSNTYKFAAGSLNKAKGTRPGAAPTDATKSFNDQLKTIDPTLKDFSYGPESYDAVVIIALAAEAAKNDNSQAIASKLNDVTRGGTKCTTFKQCVDLVKAGTDIDYDGISGPLEFSDSGEPSSATIGIYQYGSDNKYPEKALDYVEGKLE